MNGDRSYEARDTKTGVLQVSIVTPTLNRARYLKLVLESVSAQSYPHIEHIVVDGGSTDGTLEILKRFEESHGIRWISEPDHGVYQAVNKGMRLASGDVLAYLNTDDLYFPYSVEVAVRAFSTAPDVGLVYGDLLRLDSGSERASLLFYPRHDTAHLLDGGLVAQPTAFWRREVRDRCGGFDETFTLAADMEYWLRISKSYKVAKIHEVLAFEEHHGDRLSAGPEAERRAHDELARIRGMHGSAESDTRRTRRVRRIRVALEYRLLAVRFLMAHLRGGTRLGSRWDGFRGFVASTPRVRILPTRLAAGLLPLVGRRFKAAVEFERDGNVSLDPAQKGGADDFEAT